MNRKPLRNDASLAQPLYGAKRVIVRWGRLDFRLSCNFSPGFSLFSIWTRRRETGASPEWEFAAATRSSGWMGSAARVVRFDCFACRSQREGERLLGDVGHQRSDHPAKPRGNVPGQ